jgi:hypothetical protein
MSNPSWGGCTSTIGGGEGNLTFDAKGGSRLGSGLGSLLELASNNLILFFTPSKKIYNTLQKIVSNLHICSEYEVLLVVEGEILPSSPS